MLHDIKVRRPEVSFGALQKTVDIYHREDTVLNRIEHLIWKEMNPEAIHLFTDKELIILENGFFPNRAGMPDLGYTYTIIPFSHITGIEIAESKDYSLLQDCVIYMGPNRIPYHYEIDNEEVEVFYNAVRKL